MHSRMRFRSSTRCSDRTPSKRYYAGDTQNPNGRWEPKTFNASLYDVLMGVFCDKDKNQVYAALDSLRESIIDLMVTNASFNEAIILEHQAQT